MVSLAAIRLEKIDIQGVDGAIAIFGKIAHGVFGPLRHFPGPHPDHNQG